MNPGWGKVKEAARYCGLSERTFRNFLRMGLMHIRLPSGTILVRYADIDKFLEQFRVTEDQIDKITNEAIKEMNS